MDISGNTVKKRRVEPERDEYREALEWIANFLGNECALRSRSGLTEWKLQRVITIRTLNELREKLDTLSTNLNSGNAEGNTAEIESVGCSVMNSLSGVGSSLHSFIGNGLTSIPMASNVGKMITYIGTCIGGVSNTMTSSISAKYLQQIEAILEEDLTLSRPLEEWLNFSKKLDSNIQTVFGVSLASVKLNAITKIFHDFLISSRSDRDFYTTINLLRQEKSVEIEKLEKFYQYLSASPQFADRMRHILPFSNAKLEDIQIFVDGIRMCKNIIGTSSSSVETLQGVPNSEVTDTGKVSVFQSIRLALNVISLINPASIARHGTSKYSEALKQLTDSLNWELERMENL